MFCLCAPQFKGGSAAEQLRLTSEFNEVAVGDLGGRACKALEPLNSCYVSQRVKREERSGAKSEGF